MGGICATRARSCCWRVDDLRENKRRWNRLNLATLSRAPGCSASRTGVYATTVMLGSLLRGRQNVVLPPFFWTRGTLAPGLINGFRVYIPFLEVLARRSE